MQSANCNIEKTKLDGSFNITLPSLKFQEKKKLLISIKLQNFKNIKQKSINLLKSTYFIDFFIKFFKSSNNR